MKWWRILIAALCLLMASALPASAENTEWADSSYDFSKIQRVLIYDVTVSEKAGLDDDLLEQVIQEDYMKIASRPKYHVIRQDSAKAMSPEDPNQAADVYVKAELLKWQDGYYIKPAYTSWETRRGTRTVKRSDGKRYEETYTYTVPVDHPPQTIYTSTVRIRFEVFDSKTGKRVMARDELRLRDNSEHGQKGIFGRISKAFFDSFGKKINKQ